MRAKSFCFPEAEPQMILAALIPHTAERRKLGLYAKMASSKEIQIDLHHCTSRGLIRFECSGRSRSTDKTIPICVDGREAALVKKRTLCG